MGARARGSAPKALFSGVTLMRSRFLTFPHPKRRHGIADRPPRHVSLLASMRPRRPAGNPSGEAWCLDWQIEFRAINPSPASTTVLLAFEEASPASAFMSHFGGVPDSEDEVERAPVRVQRARTPLTGWCPIMNLRI